MEIDKSIPAPGTETKRNDRAIKNSFAGNSPAIEEIISHNPPFIVKWGMLLFLLLLLVIGSVSWLIKYPDRIQATVRIVSFAEPGKTVFSAEAWFPATTFGKVKPGQVALLSFPSYPEYPDEKGRVGFISPVITDSGYLVKIHFQDIDTGPKKRSRLREGLTGRVQIITQDIRLLQRIGNRVIPGERK